MWRGNSCSLHPRESGPEVVQGPDDVTTFPTLLGPVLVRNQQNYLRSLLIVGASSPPSLLLPRPSPEKEGVKMNECYQRNNALLKTKSCVDGYQVRARS